MLTPCSWSCICLHLWCVCVCWIWVCLSGFKGLSVLVLFLKWGHVYILGVCVWPCLSLYVGSWGSPGHPPYEVLAQHPSCRTATIWRSLSPFWGEEYTVHLPLDFHHLAFYVLDEDTVGCVVDWWAGCAWGS